MSRSDGVNCHWVKKGIDEVCHFPACGADAEFHGSHTIEQVAQFVHEIDDAHGQSQGSDGFEDEVEIVKMLTPFQVDDHVANKKIAHSACKTMIAASVMARRSGFIAGKLRAII